MRELLKIDGTFPALYVCQCLHELPGFPHPLPYYYPGGSQKGGSDGVLVKVTPNEAIPWIGIFAFDDLAFGGITGLFTTPSAGRLCVVAQGLGCFVSANAPSIWETIDARPILGVYPIPRHNIIVFSDFTRLVAYGPEGLKWRTKRLTWDDMNITEVTDEFIQGDFWDVAIERKANFKVNLATGVHEGGVSHYNI